MNPDDFENTMAFQGLDPHDTEVTFAKAGLKVIYEVICKATENVRDQFGRSTLKSGAIAIAEIFAEPFQWDDDLSESTHTHTSDKMREIKVLIDKRAAPGSARDFFVKCATIAQMKKICRHLTVILLTNSYGDLDDCDDCHSD